MAQRPHLEVIVDTTNAWYVQVRNGADAIVLTPPLADATEAEQVLRLIKAATQLPAGRRR